MATGFISSLHDADDDCDDDDNDDNDDDDDDDDDEVTLPNVMALLLHSPPSNDGKTVPGQLAVHNASHGSHQQYAHLETHLCFIIAKTRYVHMFNLIWPLRIFARTMQILQMRTLLGELLPEISSQFTLQHFLKFAHPDFFQQRFSTEMKKKDHALSLQIADMRLKTNI